MNTTTIAVNNITHQALDDGRSPEVVADQSWIKPEITVQDNHGQPIHVLAQVGNESIPSKMVYEIPIKSNFHTVSSGSLVSYPSSAINILVVTDSSVPQTANNLSLSQPVFSAVATGSIVSATNPSPASSNQANEKLFVCDCGQSFSQRGGLKTHMKVHTGVKPFQCNICNKRFAHKQNKEFHMRRHTGERPYKCDKCERAFICVALLNRHKREHEGNYAFKCDICDQGFILKRNYVEHMNVHTNTRPFQCNICHKSFSRREPLRVHKKMHTGETPYVCKECGKAFPLRTRLEIHMRRHTGEMPYMCLECGKAFYTSPQLNVHHRRYQGLCQAVCFECQECGASFKKQCGLSAHMRIHQASLKNSLSCSECKREFSSQRQLASHSRNHDTSLPYHCSQCLLFFSTQNLYKRHRCTPPVQITALEGQNKGSEQNEGDVPDNDNNFTNSKQKHNCNLCNKVLKSAHSLKRHLKTHEKEENKTKPMGKNMQKT